MQTEEKKHLAGTTIWRRGIWYFMRTLLLIAAIAALCYCVFTTAMRMGNLYILSTEGMQLRASCILQDGDREQLRQYFTDEFIAGDAALTNGAYQNYTISSMDYRVEVKGISVWPWSEMATVTVEDRMADLAGTYNDAQAGAASGSSLPAWEGGRYQVRFLRSDGRWYIYQIKLVEAAPSEAPAHTPDPRMTPFVPPTPTPGAATPTPAPTSTPAATLTPVPEATPTPKAKAKATPQPKATGTP